MLEGGPLQSDWWKKNSNSFVPYVNISAQLADKPDQGLLREIGARSYPTCVIMDTEGKVILRNDTAGAFRPTTESRLMTAVGVVQELLDARAAVEADGEDATARASRAILEAILGLRSTQLKELDEMADLPGIDSDLKARFRRWRAVEPISKVLKDYVAKVKSIDRSDTAARTKEFHQASKNMLEIYRKGQVLDDPRAGIFSDYWRLVFEGAIVEQDVEVATKALSVYRRAFGSRADLKNRIDRMAKRLGELRTDTEGEGR